MSPTRARRLACGLTLAGALMIASYIFSLATGTFELDIADLSASAMTVAFATVGALVAARHPSNAIGWIFLGVALFTGVSGLGRDFVECHLQDRGDPGRLVGAAAAYADVSWIPFVLVPVTFLLLLFPRGRLPSRRWRLVAWCAALGILGMLFTGLASAEALSDFPTIKNPFVIDSPVMGAREALSFLLLCVGILGSAAAAVVRFRRAGRVQRQQIKWLATEAALYALRGELRAVIASTMQPTHASIWTRAR
jgi:hypothetical protein